MNRSEHLQWCKDRALEYAKVGDTRQALGSMFSDLSKHDETRDHPAIQLGVIMMMGGFLSDTTEVKKFIDGFN